jgi:hypothetical protein
VSANGNYAWLQEQQKLNNEWLKKEYPEATKFKITAAKAELFRDENCLHPFSKKQFLVREESFLNIAETEKTVYTEFITREGQFRYGWVKKTDIKVED